MILKRCFSFGDLYLNNQGSRATPLRIEKSTSSLVVMAFSHISTFNSAKILLLFGKNFFGLFRLLVA